MNNEDKFWLLIWPFSILSIAIAISAVVFVTSSMSSGTEKIRISAIENLVKAGASPIEARCAIRGYVNSIICYEAARK